MQFHSLRDLDLRGRHVVVRADLNVPLKEGIVVDTTRLIAALPTTQYLLGLSVSVLMISHAGEPKGKPDPGLSLQPVGHALADLLHQPVTFLEWNDRQRFSSAPPGVYLLENLRFHLGEESNDPEFSRELANLGDIFVNDAFGACHRSHASTVGVASFKKIYAGFLIEREVENLQKLLDSAHPYVVILGGTKLSTKLNLIAHFLDVADAVLLGGGLANALLQAKGYNLGESRCAQPELSAATSLLSHPRINHLGLPVDLVVGNPANFTLQGTYDISRLPGTGGAFDIGPATASHFAAILAKSQTILWNGPVGLVEQEAFCRGTEAVVAAILGNTRAFRVAGGGDTLAVLACHSNQGSVDFASTGGGAMLTYLEKGTLPALNVIEKV